MTTSLDRKLPKKVKALLERFGADATLRTSTKTWANGAVTETTVASTAIKVSPPAPLVRTLVPEESTFMRCRMTMAALDSAVVPKIGDIVTIADVDWFITTVNEMRSGESIAAWELLVNQQQQ